MLSYICLGSNDLPRACRFYDAVMATLGIERCDTTAETGWDGWAGWGWYADEGRQQLALWLCQPFDGQPATASNGTMLAFAAANWQQVDAFHATALQYGGDSAGAPGLRDHYGPDFYAAYVRDPDGNKLAAVCRSFTRNDSSPT